MWTTSRGPVLSKPVKVIDTPIKPKILKHINYDYEPIIVIRLLCVITYTLEISTLLREYYLQYNPVLYITLTLTLQLQINTQQNLLC